VAGLRLPDSDVELVLHTEKRPIETDLLVTSVPAAISVCTYTDTNDLPGTFEGVSGAPAWAYKLLISNDTGEYSVGDYSLVGIVFWETPRVDNRRSLRAHFIRSIYETAWKE
jgi:hypothetical protein